jgi:hypothetical protein
MIYYNNKSASAKLQTGGQTPKNSRQNTSSPLNTQRDLRVADIKPYLVVEKRLGQVEQTGLNKYRKTLGEALMSSKSLQAPVVISIIQEST